ncbi:hypothetical protein, partial [Xanthomonas fragariae]
SQEAKNTMTTRFRQFSRVCAGLVLLCLAGAASAQWEVVDKALNEKADAIRKNQAINHGDGEQSSGEEVAKPKEKLGRIPDDQGVAACAATTTGTPVSGSQKESCELVQRTLNAQYNYVVAMYEITNERLKRLRKIEKNRQEIGGQNIGLLESNTNQLLALKAMMEIDRQQMESAMFAYDKRVAYLTGQQTAAAKAAMAGKEAPNTNNRPFWIPTWVPDNLLNLGQTIVAGVAMEVAFKAIKSKKPDGMRELAIDKD